MATVYRFRDMKQLLEEYCELEQQSIYFASPEQMNDPMEGVRDIVWNGDRIVWANLFRHYFFCLNHALLDIKFLGNLCRFRAEFIPVLGEWDREQSPQLEEMIETSWKKIHDEFRLSLLTENLEKFERKVRDDELLFYLYLVHFHMIAAIQESHIEHGVADEKERTHWQHVPLDPLLKDNAFFELLSQLETEHDGFSEKWFSAMKSVSESQRLRHKLNLSGRGAEPIEYNKHFLLFDYTSAYVEQLSRLLWTKWYGVCFAKSHYSSSMWSHYADGHEGACLIFETVESSSGSSLELSRPEISRSSRNDYTEENRRYCTMSFRDIDYKDRPASTDFFRRLGRLPIPTLMDVWYTDEKGTISECSDHFLSQSEEDAWMREYWNDFITDTCIKSTDWKHEQECRLVQGGGAKEELSESERLWNYDFESLRGIIFGIKTSDDDKLKIIEIVQEKCLEISRADFKFYQAFYSPHDGTIQKRELRIF